MGIGEEAGNVIPAERLQLKEAVGFQQNVRLVHSWPSALSGQRFTGPAVPIAI
ncbi:MAG: hypothetical protein L0332_23940 [Chloroflexi bacterium]|nr:hypothetical protein [Chloroflexota bacterium]MCI0643715.1 hypothetical protein [Chloroflexota bacterium]MCI0729745.1 hypothetical protein [Chloroflexota bacterium]